MSEQPLVVRFPGAFRSFFPEIRALWAEGVPDMPLGIGVSQPSGLLAEAVLEGEAADVLFSASLACLDLLNEIGVCEPPVVIARNRLAMAVRYEWADRVQMLADALEPGPPAWRSPADHSSLWPVRRADAGRGWARRCFP